MCYTEPVGAFVMENYMFSQTLTFHNTLISQMAKQPSLPFLTFTSLRDHAYNQLFIHKHPNLITSLILRRPVWTVSTFASKCIQHFIELNVRCVWTGRLNRSSNIVESVKILESLLKACWIDVHLTSIQLFLCSRKCWIARLNGFKICSTSVNFFWMNVDQMFKLLEQALREDIQIFPILQYYHTTT